MSDDATQPRRRSLATNSFLSVLAWVFPIALGSIATPVLVRNLGTHEYGIFSIALGFISYSFTFGAGKVAAKYVPEYLAAGELERAGESVSATFWLSLSIGVVGSLALVLIAPVLVRDVLLVPRELQEASVYALYLAGAIGLVFMLSQVFQYVLQGLHRFDNYVTLTNFNGLLLGAGNIILAMNGFGVVALLAWNRGVMAFTGILFYLRAKHLLPSIRLAPIFTREMA